MIFPDTPSRHATVTIFATFTPKPGSEPAALDVLRNVLAPTRAEPGCLRFDLFVSTDSGGPVTFHLYEIFESADAIDVHRRTVHYLAYRAEIEPLLEVPPHAVRVAPFGVVPPPACDTDGSPRSSREDIPLGSG